MHDCFSIIHLCQNLMILLKIKSSLTYCRSYTRFDYFPQAKHKLDVWLLNINKFRYTATHFTSTYTRWLWYLLSHVFPKQASFCILCFYINQMNAKFDVTMVTELLTKSKCHSYAQACNSRLWSMKSNISVCIEYDLAQFYTFTSMKSKV